MGNFLGRPVDRWAHAHLSNESYFAYYSVIQWLFQCECCRSVRDWLDSNPNEPEYMDIESKENEGEEAMELDPENFFSVGATMTRGSTAESRNPQSTLLFYKRRTYELQEKCKLLVTENSHLKGEIEDWASYVSKQNEKIQRQDLLFPMALQEVDEAIEEERLIEKSVDNILSYSHREFLRRTLTSRPNLKKVMYSLMEKDDDSKLTEREMHSIAMIMNFLMESRGSNYEWEFSSLLLVIMQMLSANRRTMQAMCHLMPASIAPRQLTTRLMEHVKVVQEMLGPLDPMSVVIYILDNMPGKGGYMPKTARAGLESKHQRHASIGCALARASVYLRNIEEDERKCFRIQAVAGMTIDDVLNCLDRLYDIDPTLLSSINLTANGIKKTVIVNVEGVFMKTSLENLYSFEPAEVSVEIKYIGNAFVAMQSGSNYSIEANNEIDNEQMKRILLAGYGESNMLLESEILGALEEGLNKYDLLATDADSYKVSDSNRARKESQSREASAGRERVGTKPRRTFVCFCGKLLDFATKTCPDCKRSTTAPKDEDDKRLKMEKVQRNPNVVTLDEAHRGLLRASQPKSHVYSNLGGVKVANDADDEERNEVGGASLRSRGGFSAINEFGDKLFLEAMLPIGCNPKSEDDLKFILDKVGWQAGLRDFNNEIPEDQKRDWIFFSSDVGAYYDGLFEYGSNCMENKYKRFRYIVGTGHEGMSLLKVALKLLNDAGFSKLGPSFGFVTDYAIKYAFDGKDNHKSVEFMLLHIRAIAIHFLIRQHRMESSTEDWHNVYKLREWSRGENKTSSFIHLSLLINETISAYALHLKGIRNCDYENYNAGRLYLLPLLFSLGHYDYAKACCRDIIDMAARLPASVRRFRKKIFSIGENEYALQGYDFHMEEIIKKLKPLVSGRKEIHFQIAAVLLRERHISVKEFSKIIGIDCSDLDEERRTETKIKESLNAGICDILEEDLLPFAIWNDCSSDWDSNFAGYTMSMCSKENNLLPDTDIDSLRTKGYDSIYKFVEGGCKGISGAVVHLRCYTDVVYSDDEEEEEKDDEDSEGEEGPEEIPMDI
jgi:hypothetical protein